MQEIDKLTLVLKQILHARVHALPRSEKAEVVRYLRDERKLKWREIGEIAGHSTSYSSALYLDPDGSRDKERKRGYGRPCLTCGRQTTGCKGRHKAPLYCTDCRNVSPEVRLLNSLHGGKGRQRWSDEECLNALRRVVAKEGTAVSFKQYNNLRQPNDPEGQTLRNRWGSWIKACRAAGVPSLHQKPSRSYPRTDPEQCYAFYEVISDKLGHPATQAEYEQYRNDHPGLPSVTTVRNSVPERRWAPLIKRWMDSHGIIIPDRQFETVEN